MSAPWVWGLSLALAGAPRPSVDLAPVDGHMLELGRPMEVHFALRHDGPGVAVWPEGLDLPEDVELLDRRVQRARMDGEIVDRLILRVRPFVAGPLVLGPYRVRLDETRVEVGPARFHVRSPLPEEVQRTLTATALDPGLRPQLEALMAPDAPPPVPTEWDSWQLAALGFGAGALGLGLGFWAWRRRRTKVAAAAPLPPPEAEARAALAQLRSELRRRPEDMQAHHETLSLVLRRLLGLPHRRGEAMTSSELPDSFAPSEARTRLIEILSAADQVKFARWPATPQEAEATIDRAEAWIERDLPSLRPAERPAGRPRPAPAAWTAPAWPDEASIQAAPGPGATDEEASERGGASPNEPEAQELTPSAPEQSKGTRS